MELFKITKYLGWSFAHNCQNAFNFTGLRFLAPPHYRLALYCRPTCHSPFLSSFCIRH